ncbi:hypothetical protein [Virgisporangium aurantiacum]|uniref:Uncharacterized protein n=1 Tax=Virgisporangium aurantiacum TaxID=175570 RepID=A0A8J3ZKM4_9ACTN|nr:hypothetical protein [Virgisporangium aurantiacum]GIJ64702.1 hypothetical protein Vau01_122180 [Virgisporangium aurantiacum]
MDDVSDFARLSLSYQDVYVRDENLAVVLASVGELVDAGVNHTFAYYRYAESWYLYKTDRSVTSVCFPSGGDDEMVLLSADGMVIRLIEGGQPVEIIDDSDEGPSDLVTMWSVAEVDRSLYAVGMARHAYRQHRGQAGWTRIDQTCFVPRRSLSAAVGFTSVAGFSPEEIYAVGWNGEIWRFDGAVWHQAPSPTGLLLKGVVRDPAADEVVAVGLDGILRGRYDRWRIVGQTVTKALNDAVAFRDVVYLSGSDGVYRLNGDAVERVELVSTGEVTTSSLAAGGGVLWSAGRSDLFRTGDGVNWERIDNP